MALPKSLDTEKSEATYENGNLTVTTQTAEPKAKFLKVKVKSLGGKDV